MMIKRLGVSACAVAVVSLAAGSVGPALGSGGDHNSDHHRTIRVLEITTEENFVDVGAKGDSLGDEYVFSAKLMRDGKQVGHDGGVCTLTSVKTGEVQCVATVWFDSGQITVQGLVFGDRQSFTLPINGGSGAYQGAEGELHIHSLDKGSVLTFHLSD